MSSRAGGEVGARQAPAKRILIVEDNALNMKLLNDILEVHGYETLPTTDGLKAVDLARSEAPDLILLDIQLPDVSGLEVTRLLRADERTRHIPIIAVTAFAMGGDRERVLAGGCDAYVAKPIDVHDFLRRVADFLAAPSS
jgi:two-component system, cell cycle response regulator DivK